MDRDLPINIETYGGLSMDKKKHFVLNEKTRNCVRVSSVNGDSESRRVVGLNPLHIVWERMFECAKIRAGILSAFRSVSYPSILAMFRD